MPGVPATLLRMALLMLTRHVSLGGHALIFPAKCPRRRGASSRIQRKGMEAALPTLYRNWGT